jgi:YD repeat-containing protein
VTRTFSYDSQRRLTSILFTYAGAPSTTSTYTAWDASGRPTALTIAGKPFEYGYDDVQRVLTITNTSAGSRQTHTYDANGNLVREVDEAPGGGATMTTVTVTRTATVCR